MFGTLPGGYRYIVYKRQTRWNWQLQVGVTSGKIDINDAEQRLFDGN
jgi:hypothetical protein